MKVSDVDEFVRERTWLRKLVLILMTPIFTIAQLFWAMVAAFSTLRREIKERAEDITDHFKYWWNYKPKNVEEQNGSNTEF